MDDLLGSVSFADGGGADRQCQRQRGNMGALEREKQDLLKKVAEIEAKQRQIAPSAAAPAAVGNVAEAGAPPDEEGKAIAAAKEKFAKDVAGPAQSRTRFWAMCFASTESRFPMSSPARWSVGGTTIAAEEDVPTASKWMRTATSSSKSRMDFIK